MADDWKPGDLALCVKLSPWVRIFADGVVGGYLDRGGPKAGATYTVRSVEGDAGAFGVWLRFSDFPDVNAPLWLGYASIRFIKVTPDAEDAFDREVIAHMAGQEVEA